MKNILINVLDILFGDASIKLKLILNIIFHKWEFIPSMLYPGSANLKNISEEKLKYVYQDIGSKSMDILLKHLFYISFSVPQSAMRMYFFHFSSLYPTGEKVLRSQTVKNLNRLKRKYYLQGACATESLIYHHGLLDQTESVKQFLKDKVFLDVGAYNGDSSIVLHSYCPSKIYAFEPDEIQIQNYITTMRKNGILQSHYEIIPSFVGQDDHKKTISLDHFMEGKHSGSIGFIKADVEGCGLDLIKGGKRLIQKYRPIISIAIYHNIDEFLGIYPLLKEWDLNYYFEVKSLGLPLVLTETVLMAIPAELIVRVEGK